MTANHLDRDPYLIIITDADLPQRVPATESKPGGYVHTQEMASLRISLDASHVRRIDQAAASIGVSRPAVIRAIIRQAIDCEAAEIQTKWGRSFRI